MALHQKPRVLVVSDALEHRVALRHLLHDAEFDVREAGTAGAVSAAADADLVLLTRDVGAGGPDELVRRFRREPASATVPIVCIVPPDTGAARRADILDSGAGSCVVEPADGRELLATLRALARLRLREASSAEHVEQLEVLYHLSDAVSRASDVAAIYDEAIAALRTLLHVDRAGILLFDADRVMRFKAWRGLSAGYRRAVEGHSPWSPDDPNPEPVAVGDVLADPALAPWRTLIRREGIRALAFIPLVHQRRLLGKLMLYYDAVHVFAPEDLRLAQTVANHVAFGLHRMLAERAIQALLARERSVRQEAEQARGQAEAANRAKDEFLAMLSHELRTPLTAMIGWARMLRTTKLDPATAARALEAIDRNTRLQAQLINDLLDISRIVSGKLQLQLAPLDLPALIEAAADSMRPAAEAKGVHIATRVETAATVAGDADRLQQVIANLLSNAIKFTPEGGLVEIRLQPEGDRVQVIVSDTGKGISTDVLPYVFDRFRQSDAPGSGPHGGLGLGLAIVRHLVALHGGTVKAESAGEGLGSSFTITLPAAVEGARRQPEAPHCIQPDAVAYADLPRLSGARVLLVEDDEDSREFIATVLSHCGAKVTTAASADQAVALLGLERPDVLVSDIRMPGKDGYALVRDVRAGDGDAPRLPAVALTAYASGDHRDRALAAGFDVYLPKPVEPAELVTVVANLVTARAEAP